MKLIDYTQLLKKSKIEILRNWVKDKSIKEILKLYNISIDVFLKNYAIHILNCYIGAIKTENKIIQCNVLSQFLKFLKNKGVSTSEFFIIFSAFKNSIVKLFHKNDLLSYEILVDITQIHENNFVTVLNSYSKTIKNVESELNKLENLMNKYIIISTTDKNGIITDVTNAFCEVSGYSRDELIGKSHNIVSHPDTKKEVYKDMWYTIKKGQFWHFHIKNRKKNGHHYWVDLKIIPNINSEGKVISHHAICQDITSQKDLEEQQNILLEQSKSAAMGEMISMIAHQWRQPLQAVSILTQKLPIIKATEGIISDELLSQVTIDIAKQLTYMSKTIDDFRNFFLPNKNIGTILVHKLIDKTLEFMKYMFKSDNINVEINGDEKLKVETYINETIQVLINILKNARDILIEKDIENRVVSINYYVEDNFIIIGIEDNAGGIDESIISKVFNPYFSTKKNKNGTGLGLYMSKTIIEKHCNGSLSVENSKEGALFKVKLPL